MRFQPGKQTKFLSNKMLTFFVTKTFDKNTNMCNRYPTSLERFSLQVSDWRRRRRHFDFDFLRLRHILLQKFFPFLRHLSQNLTQMFPLNLAWHFDGINWYLYSFLTALSRLVVCKVLVLAQTFWRSFFFDDHQQMTSNKYCSPENTRMYNVSWSVYHAKMSFYCSSEVILPLYLTEMLLLLLNF